MQKLKNSLDILFTTLKQQDEADDADDQHRRHSSDNCQPNHLGKKSVSILQAAKTSTRIYERVQKTCELLIELPIKNEVEKGLRSSQGLLESGLEYSLEELKSQIVGKQSEPSSSEAQKGQEHSSDSQESWTKLASKGLREHTNSWHHSAEMVKSGAAKMVKYVLHDEN